MNTDEFISFAVEMDPRDAPPEVIAKLYEHAAHLTKFAKAVSDRATELAKADALPGYGLKPGNRKPLAWLGDGVYPEAWYERKLLTPTQVVKQDLATEKYLLDAELAHRPEPEAVPVKLDAPAGAEVF
jgi:hypothetical protein